MLTAEEKAALADAMAYGGWAREVWNSKAWAHAFAVLRETCINKVLNAEGGRELLEAQANLKAVDRINKTLRSAIAEGETAAKARERDGQPAPDPIPIPRRQRIE